MIPLQVWMLAVKGVTINEKKIKDTYQGTLLGNSVFFSNVLLAIDDQSRGTPLDHYKWEEVGANLGSLTTSRVASLVPAGATSMSEGGREPLATSGCHQSATVRQGALTPQRASGH